LLVALVLVLGAAAGVVYFQAAGTGGSSATASDGAAADAAPAPGDGKADAAATTGAAGASGDGQGGKDGETAIPVGVVDVSRGSVSTYISATANLVPEDEVTVLAEAEGKVTRLLVEEGDSVAAGELLAALLRDEAEILHKKAAVRAANAELADERAVRLHQQDLIAQEEFDRIRVEHQVAQQELAEAEWRLLKTEIRAPFDGRLTRRHVTLGQHIRPGDELFVVTSFDPLIARIYLPEKDVLALDAGRAVGITLKADASVRFQGRIQRISPVVDTGTGTVKVTIEAIRPPPVVRPGGFVIIDIVRETHADTLVLPRKAVIRELQQAHVFVASGDVAERRAVVLGLEEQERLEILSGIETGERVVVAGQGGLKDGAKIKILPAADETGSSAGGGADLPQA